VDAICCGPSLIRIPLIWSRSGRTSRASACRTTRTGYRRRSWWIFGR
jgi:hypothetical protein